MTLRVHLPEVRLEEVLVAFVEDHLGYLRVEGQVVFLEVVQEVVVHQAVPCQALKVALEVYMHLKAMVEVL